MPLWCMYTSYISLGCYYVNIYYSKHLLLSEYYIESGKRMRIGLRIESILIYHKELYYGSQKNHEENDTQTFARC